MSQVGAIRNPEGLWINTEVFREEALHFKKYGYYCPDPWGSPDWREYWTEQRRRAIRGYTVGGATITGDHYFYLNFCPIKRTEETNDIRVKKSKKVIDFPDFWDGDYNYYWVREIAREGILDTKVVTKEEKEEFYHLDTKEQAEYLAKYYNRLGLETKIKPDYLTGGWNLIVGKSRRKGFSYKNASTAVKNYITIPNSTTILGAYEKKYLYPKGIFTMAKSYIDFISEHTAWNYPRDVINQAGKGHFKASTIEYKNGVPIEKGFLSEIMSISFKDDADSARGKDAYDFFIEESGAFGTPGLLIDTLNAILDTAKDSEVSTGLITVFGTSGDMEGGTADYADMHSNPAKYGFLPFQNIWDENSEEDEVGYFHPTNVNAIGHYDKMGNSNKESAKQAELKHRKFLLSKGATSTQILKRMQERPLGPKEAFGAVSINNFPILELQRQLKIVLDKNLHTKKGTPVNLFYDFTKKKVVAEPILTGMANVIWRQKPDNLSFEGCPVIYEYPCENPPLGAYKIGYDPYRQNMGTSLSAVYVFKSVIQGESTKNIIVAEFVGRPYEADNVNYIASLFAQLYNTTIMHENEVTHVRDYFRRKKQLHLLAFQPDKVISKNVKKSTVARVYGCHMVEALKDAGEKYIKDWLLEVQDYDENGDPIRTVDMIWSPGLLEELIKYNRKKGNFDRVMALIQVMFQLKEDEEGAVHSEEDSMDLRFKELLEMYNVSTTNDLGIQKISRKSRYVR